MEKMPLKIANEWYRLFRALFAQLFGDPADEGALCRILIYEPGTKELRALSDASESWLAMDNAARARYLADCLEEGERILLYAPQEDRPREVVLDAQGMPKLLNITELSAPQAPKKPGLISRMLDGDASVRFEEESAAYERERELSEAAAQYAEIRREQYDADREYLRSVYNPLAPGREIEAAHDLCAHEIDLLWDELLVGRNRAAELFVPAVPVEELPLHRAAAIAMGVTVAEKGMVLINYLVGEETDEEAKEEIRLSAAKAREKLEEAVLYLRQGNDELLREMTRQAIKVGVGMWQGVRVFHSASALTIGMYLSDLLECVEEDPEIEHCTLLERIDMVEARSAACVAKCYATFVGACEELLADGYPADTPQRGLLALRAVTFAATIIDLNGDGQAAYQIFDPDRLERTTAKRRFFARGTEAVVSQYYHAAVTTEIYEELASAGKDTMPAKLMDLKTLRPVLLRRKAELIETPLTPEHLHRVLMRQSETEKTL